jgi:acyl-CoA thioester hydrolase
MSAPAAERASFAHFVPLTTRWADNDLYGHVNNVVYYAFFDTAVNRFLLERAGLDLAAGSVIAVVAETMCTFQKSIAFPDDVEVGLRVAKLGRSSVRWEIGVFRGGEDEASAQGYFVHVFVDRGSRRPVSIPDSMRAALAAAQIA